MAPIQHVAPGEVIRASVINALIDAVNAGGTGGPAPVGIPVPDLFGRTLDQARAILAQPAVNLALGTALDVFGNIVEPNAPGSGGRFVLNQSPSTGTAVPAGSQVNLVIAAPSSGPIPPPPVPIQTETVLGVVASNFRVNDTLVVVGSGFSTALNTATFDGVPASDVTPDPANPTQRLFVVVPTGIPGAPVNPGDPSKAGVIIAISSAGSPPGTISITVDAPSAQPLPDIQFFTPSQQFVGGSVTVNGQNFSNVIARNIVRLGVTTAAVTSASPGQLAFTVPDLPGLGPVSGSTLAVKISLTVNDGGGNPIGTDISDNNLTVRRP